MSGEEADREGMFTRRDYLIFRALEVSGDSGGVLSVLLVSESVDSTALAHPEWDMDERRTFGEWEAQR